MFVWIHLIAFQFYTWYLCVRPRSIILAMQPSYPLEVTIVAIVWKRIEQCDMIAGRRRWILKRSMSITSQHDVFPCELTCSNNIEYSYCLFLRWHPSCDCAAIHIVLRINLSLRAELAERCSNSEYFPDWKFPSDSLQGFDWLGKWNSDSRVTNEQILGKISRTQEVLNFPQN